jgi:hypothetical protein
MRIPLAVTAIAALVAFAGPADAAKNSKPCARKGSTTVESNKRVRVYEVANTDGGENLVGCLRSDNRRQVLARGYDDNFTSSGTYDRVKLRGVVVKWRFTAVDESCKAACPPGYEPTTRTSYERNLRTRKTKTVG